MMEGFLNNLSKFNNSLLDLLLEFLSIETVYHSRILQQEHICLLHTEHTEKFVPFNSFLVFLIHLILCLKHIRIHSTYSFHFFQVYKIIPDKSSLDFELNVCCALIQYD